MSLKFLRSLISQMPYLSGIWDLKSGLRDFRYYSKLLSISFSLLLSISIVSHCRTVLKTQNHLYSSLSYRFVSFYISLKISENSWHCPSLWHWYCPVLLSAQLTQLQRWQSVAATRPVQPGMPAARASKGRYFCPSLLGSKLPPTVSHWACSLWKPSVFKSISIR